MKRIIAVVLALVTCFGLASCSLNIGEDGGGEVVANLTQLPEPTITEVLDGYVFWEEIPNASSYIVKINGYQESAGNQLRYSISSIMDSRIEADVPTTLHIFVKAKGNQILYSDSEWSAEYVYTYTKTGTADSGNGVKLSTPVFAYDAANNLITWENVENATGYEIRVNNERVVLPVTLICSYEPHIAADTDFAFSMRALGSQDTAYSDSDWSRAITYRYVPIESFDTNIAFVNKARELGIGYGYNFIDDVYFDVTNSSSNSVVNLNKLFAAASLNTQASSYTKYDSIYSESITDFQLGVAASLDSEVSAGGAFGIYSANVAAGLQSSTSINYHKYSKSGFLNCYSYSEYKNYQIVDYGTSLDLAGYLSDTFLRLVNKQGAYANLTDTEVANYILQLYGTHLVLGVKTGGRLDYYYSFATNSSSVALDFKNKITASGSLGIAGLISGSTNNSISAELKTSIEKNKTENNSSFVIYGGSTEGITASNLEDMMISWSSSINESNARSIGVPKNGIVYLPTLISYINPSLGIAMDTLINHLANDAYRTLISKFTTSDISFGDENDYVLIYTADEFINEIGNDLTGNYAIMNDIDFNGQTLVGFDSFSGTIRGHVENGTAPALKNFTLASTNKQYLGLFSTLEKTGKILDLNVDQCTVNHSLDNKGQTEGACGVFAGLSKGLIENCEVKNSTVKGYLYKNIGTDTALKLHVGAVVGCNNAGNIVNCKSTNNTLNGRSNGGVTDGTIECNIGGIVGKSTGVSLVNKCTSSGLSILLTLRGGKTWTITNVKMNGRAGGIVGYNGTDGSVFNCTADANNVSNFTINIQKAESTGYDNLTVKGVFIGKNNGSQSGNVSR